MPPESGVPSNQEAIIRRYPLVTYFALTFLISWMGALAVATPPLIRHQPLPKMTGILMFPVMLLVPSFAGIVLTRIVDGKSGLRVLFSQMSRAWVPPEWYTALPIPPFLADRSPLSAEIRLPGLCFQQLGHRRPIWDSGWFPGRNRLDGLCIPENAFPKQCAGLDHPTRGVVGPLALTCHQLSWDRDSTWRLLVAVFSRLQLGYDGYASADRVDLYEHEKRVVGAAHACKFDRLHLSFLVQHV
jgi:hypothetical protein